jgi:L-fuculose-phosphate aldolase
MLEEFKRKVAETARDMFEAGLVTSTWGNVSARVLEPKFIVITPSGLCKGLLNSSDMVTMDLDGKIVDGIRKPSSETPMHLAIYRKRPDVNAIIHTHSPFATSFAVARVEIPVVEEELAAVVGGSVRVARYAVFGTEKLGRNVCEALGDKNAVLLQNHGVVTVGHTLKEAYRVAVVVENAAKIFVFSKLIGEPVKIGGRNIRIIRKNFMGNYPKF